MELFSMMGDAYQIKDLEMPYSKIDHTRHGSIINIHSGLTAYCFSQETSLSIG
ncbi:hypothetical protein ACFFIP_06755 [Fontibacter flavus]|uniref:Uncharacterized protein n=1 Tax=Fontibacter flavus TaxID=654838 RepID=A0ABV6FRB6_9BACT